MRTCNVCGLPEGQTEFSPSQKTRCKNCVNDYNRTYHAEHRDETLERKRIYRRDHPETVKASQAKWQGKRSDYNRTFHLAAYGLTPARYDELLAGQGGVCAICRKPASGKHPLYVDHDHTCCPSQAASCGACVRGLLCSHCNRGIGAFRDDESLLFAAADYLRNAVTGT